MEEVLLESGNSRPVNVKVGCDLKGVKVREREKVTYMLEFKFEDDNWGWHTKG